MTGKISSTLAGILTLNWLPDMRLPTGLKIPSVPRPKPPAKLVTTTSKIIIIGVQKVGATGLRPPPPFGTFC